MSEAKHSRRNSAQVKDLVNQEVAAACPFENMHGITHKNLPEFLVEPALELLKELCVQLNHRVAGPNRAHLEGVKGSNKVTKTARALFAVPIEGDNSRMRTATNQLAERRIAAANRWS